MEGRPPLCALVSHVSDYSRFQAIPQYKKFPIHLHFRVICGICCKTVVKLNKHPGLNVWKCLFFKRFLKWHDSYYLYYLYTDSASLIIHFPADSRKSYLYKSAKQRPSRRAFALLSPHSVHMKTEKSVAGAFFAWKYKKRVTGASFVY